VLHRHCTSDHNACFPKGVDSDRENFVGTSAIQITIQILTIQEVLFQVVDPVDAVSESQCLFCGFLATPSDVSSASPPGALGILVANPTGRDNPCTLLWGEQSTLCFSRRVCIAENRGFRMFLDLARCFGASRVDSLYYPSPVIAVCLQIW
jgi:hypothetical protein